MKNIRLLISVLLILLILSTSVLASGNQLKVSMNGSQVAVTKVPIIKDGKSLNMDLPPFVYIDRTLVPIRFVAESLGAVVDWNQKTSTAYIKDDDKIIELKIDSSIAVVNGKRVELDKNMIPRLVTYDGEIDANTVISLAFVSEVLGYEAGWNESTKSVSIASKRGALEDSSSSEKEVSKPVEPEKPVIDYSKLNNIKSIKKEKINGKDSLVIEGTRPFKVNTMELNNPKRIVVDILDGYLGGADKVYTYDYDIGFISGVRASQFSPDSNYNKDDIIVRTVLDIKSGVSKPELEIETKGNSLIISPSKNIWDIIDIDSNGALGTLTINTLRDTTYNVSYNKHSKIMDIDIPSNAIDLDNNNLLVEDPLIETIKINSTSSNTNIKIHFRRDIEYTQLSGGSTSKIKLEYRRNSNIKPSDRIIVLDPGHGGTDPGTVSKNKTREKDVVFNVTKKLEAELRSKGYNVIMTRDTDVKIDLRERPAIANRNYADIFISIHANSADTASANGIELLYAPSTKGSVKQEGQLLMNKFILDELIKATGATNRGLKERPNLVVLRESKMPATLIEIGFLSNPTEEKLITDSSYQDKIVLAISRGIEKYFQIY